LWFLTYTSVFPKCNTKGPPNNKVDKSMSNSYRMLDDQVCQKGS
jgi:hypothetical protein